METESDFITDDDHLPTPTEQLVALQSQNNARLARVLASKNPRDYAYYKHELEQFLRKRMSPEEYDCMRRRVSKLASMVQNRYIKLDVLELNIMMAMADVIAHKDTLDYDGTHILKWKQARSSFDYFGQRQRARASLSQYETVLRKVCDNIEATQDYDVPLPDPATALQIYSADDIVTAVCKHYTQEGTRATVLEQLVNIYDMQGLYVEKSAFVKEYKRRFPELKTNYKRARSDARAMTPAQLEKVKELSAHLCRLATEVVENHKGKTLCIDTWNTLMDYLLVASLYGAPDERYESPRCDFAQASFCSGDQVYVKVTQAADGLTDAVTINYKHMNKTGQSLTVDLSKMAPTLAGFLVKYRAMLARMGAVRYLLFCSPRYEKKLFEPLSTGYYKTLLARTFKRHEAFLGFDVKAVCGAGCNGARHSHKRYKRGPPITDEDREDLAQQGHSQAVDASY